MKQRADISDNGDKKKIDLYDQKDGFDIHDGEGEYPEGLDHPGLEKEMVKKYNGDKELGIA